MKIAISIFLLLLSACATYEVTPSGRTQKTISDYMTVLDKYTDKARRYSGFYNTIDIEGTLLSLEVLKAQVEQSAFLYQWEESKVQEELSKKNEKTSSQTEFFISFYTPDRKHDTLFKNDSIWKIFLDVDGRRYEGTATKIKMDLIAIEGLYPYHNRFYTPYSVVFPVPLVQVQDKPAQLTVTGAVGSATLKYNQK